MTSKRPRLERGVVERFRAIHAFGLAALVSGIAVFLRGGSNWFFFDEWRFIAQYGLVAPARESIWSPHNEHWSTVPVIAYKFLYELFGLSSYLPYLGVVFALHVGLAWLLWRLAQRWGAHAWEATALSAVFLLYGVPASQTYLWAFQIGWIGTLFYPLAAIYLATSGHAHQKLLDGLAVLALLAGLGSGGNAVIMTALFFAIVTFVRGWRTGTLLTGVPAMAYAVWYLAQDPGQSIELGPESLFQLPEFAWAGVQGAVDSFIGVGPAILVAAVLLGYAVILLAIRDFRFPSAVMAVGSFGYLMFVGLGRAESGVEQASAGRYQYVVGALLLPLAAVGLSQLSSRLPVTRVLSGALMGLALVVNVGYFIHFGGQLSDRSSSSQEVILAAADLLASGEDIVGGRPEPVWAPDLDTRTLRALVESNSLADGRYSYDSEMTAVANLQLEVAEVESAAIELMGSIRGSGEVELSPRYPCVDLVPLGAKPRIEVEALNGGRLTVRTLEAGEITLYVARAGSELPERPSRIVVHPGGREIEIVMADRPLVVAIQFPQGEATVCGIKQ